MHGGGLRLVGTSFVGGRSFLLPQTHPRAPAAVVSTCVDAEFQVLDDSLASLGQFGVHFAFTLAECVLGFEVSMSVETEGFFQAFVKYQVKSHRALLVSCLRQHLFVEFPCPEHLTRTSDYYCGVMRQPLRCPCSRCVRCNDVYDDTGIRFSRVLEIQAMFCHEIPPTSVVPPPCALTDARCW